VSVSPSAGDDWLARARADVHTERAHLNHAGMSLTPRPVVARVQAHLDREAEIGGYEAALEAAAEVAAVPEAVAGLLGVTADEISITDSATRAWEVAAWSLAETFGYRQGDRVVMDRFAYGTVHATLGALHRSHGLELVVAPAHDDGTADLDALVDLVDERTRLVVATHIPTHVGTVTDVAALGARLAGSGTVYAVDISQSLGQLSVDLDAVRCDVAFGPGRKFLRAPRGTAVLYVRRALAEQLVPLTLPFGVLAADDPDRFTLPGGMRRFDQFESGVAARLGLGEAARYASALGLERIADEVAARSAAVWDLLRGADLVLPTGTPEDRGILSFVHQRMGPDELVAAAADQGVNLWVNPVGGAPFDAAAGARLPSVRVSPHYVTTDGDLERLERVLGGR
jgi:cysteine desulfurase/selenocysteine lyase